MTATLISLLSILCGVLGAVILGVLKTKYTLGFTTNCIVGVFASVFVVKSMGRLGFTPSHIVVQQQVNYLLLAINLCIAITSGCLGVIATSLLKKKLFDK